MADRDTTTTLNPGVGGDSMDESSVYELALSTGVEASVGKRPRVVIGGELERAALVEPERDGPGERFALPTMDRSVRELLGQILESQVRIEAYLQALAEAALRKD